MHLYIEKFMSSYSAWEAKQRAREPGLHTCIYVRAITLDVKHAFHFKFLGYRFNLLIHNDLSSC